VRVKEDLITLLRVTLFYCYPLF